MINKIISVKPRRNFTANEIESIASKGMTYNEIESLARKGMVYNNRFELKEKLAKYLPYKRRQLKELRAMHAPKAVIDSTIAVIKCLSRRYRKLLTWSCKKCDRAFGDAMFAYTFFEVIQTHELTL